MFNEVRFANYRELIYIIIVFLLLKPAVIR